MSRKGSKELIKLRPPPQASDERPNLLSLESRHPPTVSLQRFFELADKALRSKPKRKHK